MTWINGNTPKRRLSAKFAGGLAVSAWLALGAFAGSANADEYGDHGGYHQHNWNGGYYHAPPVVYGSPYGNSYYGAPGYYAPPLGGYRFTRHKHRHPISLSRSETATAGSDAGRFASPGFG
jgi:hypothetical protein